MISNKISNGQIKQIRLLQTKKYRQKYDQFIVEGVKSVQEFLRSDLECLGLFTSVEHFIEFQALCPPGIIYETKPKQMEQISALKSPQEVLAIFKIPKLKNLDVKADFILALEDIRDPGNLGTIIRSADWFGFSQIVCSNTCVDCFNPKVVQASMGSLARIKVFYLDLKTFIESNTEHQLVLTDMKGEDYRSFAWSKNIIVIGNEGKGISSELRSLQHAKISILKKGGAESLNAAISASIILANLA
ncbi:MAG: RNA methyltransferase [Chitinophagales bacterium]|nr:RNA methyltransferase [Chitinophagales bacterium]